MIQIAHSRVMNAPADARSSSRAWRREAYAPGVRHRLHPCPSRRNRRVFICGKEFFSVHPPCLCASLVKLSAKNKRIVYDHSGLTARREAVTDRNGVQTIYEYDALGNVTRQWNEPERGRK